MVMLIAFFLPLNAKIVVPFIAIFGLISIVHWVKYGIRKLSFLYWPFIFLFILYAVGLLYTTNFDYGLKDIETRMTFVLFPLFFGLTKYKNPVKLQHVNYALILGCVVSVFFCYYYASVCFGRFGYIECYEGVRLAFSMHPTYLAIYFVIALLFLWTTHSFNSMNTLMKIASILVTILFVFMIYRFYSLGPWIALFSALTVLATYYFYLKGNKKTIALSGLIVVGVVVFAVNKLDFIASDVGKVKKELRTYFEDPDAYYELNKNEINSINTRIVIWMTSAELVSQHPFGVGTGDTRDALMNFYLSKGMTNYAERKLNPHNQYMQTTLTLGWLGLVVLVITLLFYFVKGVRNNHLSLIMLISVFSTACLFESVLERAWGIVFFMFFLSIALRDSESKETEKLIAPSL